MATAGARGAGKATAAAEASADAAASGAIGGLAETFASAAATSVAGTASVMAKAAAKSKSRGQAQWEAFAKSQVCHGLLNTVTVNRLMIFKTAHYARREPLHSMQPRVLSFNSCSCCGPTREDCGIGISSAWDEG